MLLKKIIGILIIILNVGGIGFIIFSLGMMLKEKFSLEEKQAKEVNAVPAQKSDLDISNDDIIPDEDDLLKDMDLSDLDNLNFDDFE
ncbi:MAG: hypothetical protein ABIJ59_04120 [Pseudomonadota bacterium]